MIQKINKLPEINQVTLNGTAVPITVIGLSLELAGVAIPFFHLATLSESSWAIFIVAEDHNGPRKLDVTVGAQSSVFSDDFGLRI